MVGLTHTKPLVSFLNIKGFCFVHQVFASVEVMDQTETEPRTEEDEIQHSSPVKDIPKGTVHSPQLPSPNPSSPDLSNLPTGSDSSPLVTESAVGSTPSQQSAEASKVLNETTTAGSQQVEEEALDSVAEDKTSETERMETVSESDVAEDSEIPKPQEVSETEEKPEVVEKDTTTNEQSEVSKAVDANMNLRSAPGNTNVLKLETEIHNEYFQAPPLGQTLTFQAHKSKDQQVEPICLLTTEKDTNPPNEKKPETSEKTETTSERILSEIVKACTTGSERKDAEVTVSGLAETKKDKAAEIPFEKPGSNSPVRQVLNALQSASRGSLSLSSHSRQSPDTADSDDSPSALEMEDIPTGITCLTSEDIKARPLAGLAAPPVSLAQREKMGSEDHLDTACNTSPEGTDLGLSEEEPEMENVLTAPESAGVVGDSKHDESSDEQTYSVSVLHMITRHASCCNHKHIPTYFTVLVARNIGHVLDQLTSY